jgi:hypothetical protein
MKDTFGDSEEFDCKEILTNFRTRNVEEFSVKQNFETCKYCGSLLKMNMNNIESCCNDCGIVSNNNLYEEKCLNSNTKLKLVGTNSYYYQQDLFRSDVSNTNELQFRQILCERTKSNEIFIKSITNLS